jgi:DNA modification methylase
LIERFPELRDAPTKHAIRKAAKGLESLDARMKATDIYQKIVNATNTRAHVECGNAITHMEKMEDNSVDVLLTDPPYGIDIDKNALSTGKITGGLNVVGFKYEDSQELAFSLYEILAEESARFVTPVGHAYVFVAPENFQHCRKIFMSAGWMVYIKPLIWHKMGVYHQTNAPSMWPASSYEMIMFCRKPDSRLVLEGKIDVLSFPPVNSGKRLHQAEKPVDLGKELLSRTCLPGQVMYDPFMGSGAFIAAGLDMKLIVYGCDILQESYSATLQRLAERGSHE